MAENTGECPSIDRISVSERKSGSANLKQAAEVLNL